MALADINRPTKSWRRLLKFSALGIVLLVVLLFIVLIIAPILVAEFQLWQHARDVFSWSLPPNTEKIGQTAALILPMTSVCYSEVDLHLATRLSADEIEAYYRDNYGMRPNVSEGVVVEGETDDGKLLVRVIIWGRVTSNDIRC